MYIHTKPTNPVPYNHVMTNNTNTHTHTHKNSTQSNSMNTLGGGAEQQGLSRVDPAAP
jgi:hypothetical protein